MLKVPDYKVSEFEAARSKERIQGDIQRQDFVWRRYVVSDLPTDASTLGEPLGAKSYNLVLFRKVVRKSRLLLVRLPDVVRRRGHDQAGAPGWNLAEQVAAVAVVQRDLRVS